MMCIFSAWNADRHQVSRKKKQQNSVLFSIRMLVRVNECKGLPKPASRSYERQCSVAERDVLGRLLL